MEIKDLIPKYIKIKNEWEKIYHLDWLTRFIYEKDLQKSIEVDNKLKDIKKQIRKEVWFLNYQLFKINKNKFYDKFYFNKK